jgi:protein-L-isoaspartate(D-aspartate) O-methyltransferase
MTAEVLTRISDTEWDTEALFETVLPYLVNAEPKSHFSL